ncbi:SMP-30/gluconolactonase/LRE family protein [Patulibacter sp. SYSU D01012]|uniref:SMP-30/gluconolactonase/LRE family protein n=1 Tax=Patulibacter sp. SYSU D01012 TaxID=2817381 RepID=UPI001B3032BC|nr:SMP-30/gluconolactonase/LRE family protein [Patulibacter sp. SYSU D01012]
MASSSPALAPLGTTVAHHGEGAVWHARRGVLLWVDITGRCVHATAPDGTTTTVGLADQTGALAPAADGTLVAGSGRTVARVALPDGEVTPLASAPGADRPVRTNDAGVDPDGRLWLGTMARDEDAGHGTVLRLDGRDELAVVQRGVSIPNGPVWSPDGATMYLTDTPTGQVRAYAYDRQSGALGPDRVVVDARGLDGHPDGMAVDANGDLWIAFFGGSAVRCFTPAGALVREVALPVAQPTRPAFGGPDGRTLFVTTSRKGLDDAALAEQPLAGRLFAGDAGVAGVVPPPAVLPR